ncbi:hypothetical protein QUF74_04730 [Candidatus Halobeggiatoa sp. HSG11]|nr:hypothetical protein [Candidatus Halobeggiatoa sp. HSG11]
MPALRPLFTTNIIKTLQRGISVNLIAQDGQGRRRLLEDIKYAGLKNTRVVILNMTNYRETYEKFIEILWNNCAIHGVIPKTLGELLKEVENTIDYNIVLILHHFDELLNNLNTDFNADFFDQLNDIKNYKKISLLCVTTESHDQSVVCAKNQVNRYSWLDLDKKRLPKLTYDEIMVELKYRDLPLSAEEISQVSRMTSSHVKPYSLLNFFVNKINIIQMDKDTLFHEKLKILTEQFHLETKQANHKSYII